jgi:uncharacterized membrane protein YfcA
MGGGNFIHFPYTIAGFVVGALVGLTGVGGGSLMTPILVLLFGVHPATAVGTDLLYAAATKSAGTIVHGLKGSVDWRITLRLAAGSVPAATITLILLHRYGMETPRAAHLIQAVLGVALLVTAVALIFRPQLTAFAMRHRHAPGEARTLLFTVLAYAGLVVGLRQFRLVAVEFGVTVLLLLAFSLPTVRIVGSDIAHAVPLTLVAGMGHAWLGSFDLAILLPLLVGSVPAIVLGSLIARVAPERALRTVLAAVLLIVAGQIGKGFLAK